MLTEKQAERIRDEKVCIGKDGCTITAVYHKDPSKIDEKIRVLENSFLTFVAEIQKALEAKQPMLEREFSIIKCIKPFAEILKTADLLLHEKKAEAIVDRSGLFLDFLGKISGKPVEEIKLSISLLSEFNKKTDPAEIRIVDLEFFERKFVEFIADEYNKSNGKAIFKEIIDLKTSVVDFIAKADKRADGRIQDLEKLFIRFMEKVHGKTDRKIEAVEKLFVAFVKKDYKKPDEKTGDLDKYLENLGKPLLDFSEKMDRMKIKDIETSFGSFIETICTIKSKDHKDLEVSFVDFMVAVKEKLVDSSIFVVEHTPLKIPRCEAHGCPTWLRIKQEYYGTESDLLEDKRILAGIRKSLKRNRIINESDSIRNIIERRGITQLVHFTRSENLESILKHGLVPLSEHKSLGILSSTNDTLRLDNKPECTSLSVSFPNYQLFCKFRNEHGCEWTIIQISPDVLTQNRDVYFYKSNAAGRASGDSTSKAFESMFAKPQRQEIDVSLTTDPQAEILISGIIEPNDFEGIIFASEKAMKEFSANNKNIGLKMSVDGDFFRPRKDWEYWQKKGEA